MPGSACNSVHTVCANGSICDERAVCSCPYGKRQWNYSCIDIAEGRLLVCMNDLSSMYLGVMVAMCHNIVHSASPGAACYVGYHACTGGSVCDLRANVCRCPYGHRIMADNTLTCLSYDVTQGVMCRCAHANTTHLQCRQANRVHAVRFARVAQRARRRCVCARVGMSQS